jgi:hypothetical protein
MEWRRVTAAAVIASATIARANEIYEACFSEQAPGDKV